MPIISSHKTMQTNANQQILESINTNGLCSLKDVPRGVITNPVLQTQSIDGNVCVNYLTLEKASKQEQAQAIEAAVYEEYCGIYGISLERQWPFQQFTSPIMREAEMTERLNHSIVYLLAPPKLHINTYNAPQLLGPMKFGIYADDDGVSQTQGRNLMTLSSVRCRHIAEFKTTHRFSRNEIQAIFVPDALYETASSIYRDIPIIRVAACTKTFQDIPDILNRFHQQKLSSPMTLIVPDYYSALLTYINKHKLQTFSLHAVRLQTQFDFITRKISSVTQQENLLNSTQAFIQHQYPDNSAWITVHKNYGLSKKPLFEVLRKDPNLMLEGRLQKMQQAASQTMALFDRLSAAKGESTLIFLYQDLLPFQIRQLEKIGVDITTQPYFYILNFAKTQQLLVDSIIKRPEHLAAETMQAAFRGFWARKPKPSDPVEPLDHSVGTTVSPDAR